MALAQAACVPRRRPPGEDPPPRDKRRKRRGVRPLRSKPVVSRCPRRQKTIPPLPYTAQGPRGPGSNPGRSTNSSSYAWMCDSAVAIQRLSSASLFRPGSRCASLFCGLDRCGYLQSNSLRARTHWVRPAERTNQQAVCGCGPACVWFSQNFVATPLTSNLSQPECCRAGLNSCRSSPRGGRRRGARLTPGRSVFGFGLSP